MTTSNRKAALVFVSSVLSPCISRVAKLKKKRSQRKTCGRPTYAWRLYLRHMTAASALLGLHGLYSQSHTAELILIRDQDPSCDDCMWWLSPSCVTNDNFRKLRHRKFIFDLQVHLHEIWVISLWRSSDQGQSHSNIKKAQNSPFPQKNFNHNDSGSVEDRTVKFACSMECSARADRIVWPSHSSCDRNTIIRGWLDLPYTLEGNLALAFFFRIIMFNFLLINIITTTTIIIMITIINYCTCLTSTGNCINGRFMLHDLSSLSAASHTGRTRQ